MYLHNILYYTYPTRIIQVQPEQVALLMANPIINKGAVEGRILFIIKNPAIPSPMRHDEGMYVYVVYVCSLVYRALQYFVYFIQYIFVNTAQLLCILHFPHTVFITYITLYCAYIIYRTYIHTIYSSDPARFTSQ